jgi:hypothetical protein
MKPLLGTSLIVDIFNLYASPNHFSIDIPADIQTTLVNVSRQYSHRFFYLTPNLF